MSNRLTHATRFGFSIALLGCWLVMFAAGTDVWHDTGRPDLWNTQGVPWYDLRVFVVTFYLLFPLLLAQFALAAVSFVRGGRGRDRSGRLPVK